MPENRIKTYFDCLPYFDPLGMDELEQAYRVCAWHGGYPWLTLEERKRRGEQERVGAEAERAVHDRGGDSYTYGCTCTYRLKKPNPEWIIYDKVRTTLGVVRQ